MNENDLHSLNVDYSLVKEIKIVENNKLVVTYNEKGIKEKKNMNHITLYCENESNANKIKILLEEKSKNILE